MTEPKSFDPESFDRIAFDPMSYERDIRALQQWLRDAWQQLADPTLTTFTRRELRTQMKQCSADLRSQLQKASEYHPQPADNSGHTFSKPDLRILA